MASAIESMAVPEHATLTQDPPLHPFFPVDLLIPGYIPTSIPAGALLTTFFGSLAVIFASTKFMLEKSRPGLSRGDVWTASWFVLCGFIHTFFEGYYSYHSLDMGSRTHLFGQLWKEYSLSDSRYMTKDSFVACMETVTAFCWGPLSFLCAYYISTAHSLRYPMQSIVSLGQLYGLILYYGTCAFEEYIHGIVLSRPERVYYWAYYVLCNAFWLFIPAWLIVQSTRETSAAFAKVSSMKKLAQTVKLEFTP